jgi:hypothetical protein
MKKASATPRRRRTIETLPEDREATQIDRTVASVADAGARGSPCEKPRAKGIPYESDREAFGMRSRRRRSERSPQRVAESVVDGKSRPPGRRSKPRSISPRTLVRRRSTSGLSVVVSFAFPGEHPRRCVDTDSLTRHGASR